MQTKTGRMLSVLCSSAVCLVLLSATVSATIQQANKAEQANDRGAAHANQGEHDKAIADYTQAIQLDPKSVGAYYNRANSYDNKGDQARAIADYTQAIGLDPELVGAYVNRGNVYRQKREFDKAITDLTEAIRLD